MAVIEYSRNVLGYADANSTEMNEHRTSVVSLMEEHH
jgi:CTP synthase